MATLNMTIAAHGTHCVLTSEHAACSYGQPVLLIDGVPHGPGEMRGEVLTTAPLGVEDSEAAALVEAARAAGFDVDC